ncbi:DUF429 domain-containing protein [Roseomonas populi]|uniref:DUF429 domain-containing protein n=1 Tax=Roseomonas populi TaxID=3121582 RepID=A0ABT1XBJ5_9PROT|nr:DUF429 domain-containing protein [Roseomonas pecuniae]MCR0985289.1 DUF429 domain-containing protein [Roseomonas pecuniae]
MSGFWLRLRRGLLGEAEAQKNRTNVVGFDGCRAGWIGCIWAGPGSSPHAAFLPSLRMAEERLQPDVDVIAIDIPLGLQAAASPGGRPCDQHARRFIGPRASSVFSPPAQGALFSRDYEEANRLNRASGPDAPGLSKQAVALFPKLREAEQALAASSWLRERTIEVHPEVCFRAMAGQPLAHAKKRSLGKDERRQLLTAAGFVGLHVFETDAKQAGAVTDDALDACAAAWTAWRRSKGEADCFPLGASGPDYSMRIWF